MVDLKKLTASFLVLASIVSSLAFVFSETIGKNPAPQSTNLASAEGLVPPISGNAFVEQAPESSLIIDNEPGLPSIIKTSNLTENVAQSITREFFRANKSGPEAIEGSKQKFTLPPDAELDSMVKKNLVSPEAIASIQLPNFAEEAREGDLEITGDNDTEGFYRYLSSIDATLKKTILSEEADGVFRSAPSFEAIAAAQYAHGNALYALKSTPVPSALLDLHKSLVQTIENRKKFADIPASGSDDPLKTLAVLEATLGDIDRVLTTDAERLIQEYKKIDAQKISLFHAPRLADFIQNLIAPRAYAVALAVPITDYVAPNAIVTQASTYGTWLRKIWEWTKNVLLQKLKNQLIRMIEQQIVGWINGNGDPQFVTDWKGFLGTAFDRAAGAALKTIYPQLCSGIQLSIRAAFLPLPDLSQRYGCTLSRAVQNVQRFYNNFSQGGFPAYFAAIQDNFFLMSIETSDAILRAGIAAQQAKLNEALAGGGFLSTQKCPNDPEAGTPTRPQSDGLCWDGSRPIITTPGKTVGDALTKSLTLSSDLIINAKDIAGLVAVVVDASINRLIREGLNGIRGVFTSTPSSRGFATDTCGHLAAGSAARTNCVRSATAAQALATEDADTPSPPGSTPDNTVIIIPDSTSTVPSAYAVSCAPKRQTVVLRGAPRRAQAEIRVSKVGRFTTGNGIYDWDAPGGTPSSVIGTERTTFATTYASTSAPGTPFAVTVASGGATSTCEVVVIF